MTSEEEKTVLKKKKDHMIELEQKIQSIVSDSLSDYRYENALFFMDTEKRITPFNNNITYLHENIPLITIYDYKDRVEIVEHWRT